jgi:16S rRNA (cytidine1402-2'-O)-methyltransferase
VLYLISTPIGHLDDISKRALATLSSCALILCEDTRRSSILLKRYAIATRCIAYHKFNEKKALEDILLRLENGEEIALISDAGTPCINDPGLALVQECIARKIPFTAIPGPCSPIQALLLSGLDTDRFQYIGFLPKKARGSLREALGYPGTTIALESPERIEETLQHVLEMDPVRHMAVAREMTKTFEECLRGNAAELLAHFAKHKPRGEIILVIAKGNLPETDMSIEELVEMLQQFHGLSLKEAIKTAARLQKIPKRSIYNRVHQNPSPCDL